MGRAAFLCPDGWAYISPSLDFPTARALFPVGVFGWFSPITKASSREIGRGRPTLQKTSDAGPIQLTLNANRNAVFDAKVHVPDELAAGIQRNDPKTSIAPKANDSGKITPRRYGFFELQGTVLVSG
jgi:hypothetical protein